MPERFIPRILSHLSDARYDPKTARELAADLQVDDEDFDEFYQAIEHLLEEGTLVLGGKDTIGLPPVGKDMVGSFRKHERGFGFVVPEKLTQHGDLFIPPGQTGGAMTGDVVRAKVRREGGRAGGGKSPFVGKIVEVLQRAERKYAGTLARKGDSWAVLVDGNKLHDPVLIRDPHAKGAKEGDKVVIELVSYPESDRDLAEGVIVEVLGEAGRPDVETLAVMHAYGLPQSFPEAVSAEAREASTKLPEREVPEDRLDLTGSFILTIDPPDAKDYDDAISIEKLGREPARPEPGSGGGDRREAEDEDTGENTGAGTDRLAETARLAGGEAHPDAAWRLGVHIADVSAYVTPGSTLDREAYERGNSTYLPRRVVPMLPEVLSNGVCSLQEGVNRFAKTVFIDYDHEGKPVGARFARTVIRSAKRLTYLEAQALIDGDLKEAIKHTRDPSGKPKYPKPLSRALRLMDELAKTIRKRRMREGMIVLGLPEVELEFDDAGRVVDAHPSDDAFTHTLIEMFMVEANEAAARLFAGMDVPMIRRIHPDPDAHDVGDLKRFARVAGFNIPAKPSRMELQALLDATRGKPSQQAVHIAVLRTLSKAEYSPLEIGHFALASEHYTHFTSPIRRYPDLVVHRGIDSFVNATDNGENPPRGTRSLRNFGRDFMRSNDVPDEERLKEIGRHCSATERNSEQAERELRNYLVLELMAQHEGEDFAGTVTGVTGGGAFIQIDRYLIDGFVRTPDLPGARGERWQINDKTGALVAQRSGRTISIGDRFTVRIAKVDLTTRKMDLVILDEPKDESKGDGGGGGGKKKSKGKKQGKAMSQSAGPKKKSKAKSGGRRKKKG